MSIHSLIPEKVIVKAVFALGWLSQTIFAAALPDIYQSMPKQMVIVFLGLTPESLSRLKYFTPALVATLVCYLQQKFSWVNTSTLYRQQEFKCCPGS
ncbi:hypothetical protein HDF18_24305 [Mucilaginibacter sp. X5P1]|uniref:hypothetical protein n=1 Tax=Mucilaginibacter sp. X5P1 TaxID=2723088 RepID=UPI00160F498D|nr:hypothetical protein [Mucilaginibacter sp. X5P1]MBB6142030.1 hypothetical protein [Mucilaginibacter sp. X5P1]